MTPVEQAEFLGIDTRGYASGQRKVLCPKCSHTRRHNRREPCLSINMDGEVLTWQCHHCGWTGPKSGDLPASDNGYGARLQPEGRQQRKTYTKPEPPPVSEEDRATKRLYEFFGERGITRSTVDRFRITTDGRAIQFPYFRDGDLVNIKHRWVKDDKKRFRMESGAELIMYGLDACRGADQVVVVEGEMDVLALAEAGIDAVLSPPNGAPAAGTDISTAKLEYLPSGQHIFDAASTVVMAGDMDTPGQQLVDELARRIGREKCWKVAWPEGCKDANDTLIAHGADVVRRCIADMTPYPVEGITRPADYGELIWKYRDHHEQGVRLVNWPRFGELARFSLGQLSIWTGVPGSGKSAVINNAAIDLAMNHGWKIGLFSPEYYPPELLTADLVKIYLNKPLDRRNPRRASDDEVRQALSAIDTAVSYIMPEHPTLDDVLERARALVYREGLSMIVIDPWTELDQTDRGQLSETDWIDQALKKIRRFGRNFNVHMAVTAHPTKMKAIEDRDGTRRMPVVHPYDISGSRHWFEMGDLMVSIWRDKELPDEPVQAHIQKVRFRGNGEIGIVYLRFDRDTGTYLDVSDHIEAADALEDMETY